MKMGLKITKPPKPPKPGKPGDKKNIPPVRKPGGGPVRKSPRSRMGFRDGLPGTM